MLFRCLATVVHASRLTGDIIIPEVTIILIYWMTLDFVYPYFKYRILRHFESRIIELHAVRRSSTGSTFQGKICL